MHFGCVILGDQAKADAWLADEARTPEVDYFEPVGGAFWLRPGRRSLAPNPKLTDEDFVAVMASIAQLRGEYADLPEGGERSAKLRGLDEAADALGDAAIVRVGDIDLARQLAWWRAQRWAKYTTERVRLTARGQQLLDKSEPEKALWRRRVLQRNVASMVSISEDEPLTEAATEFYVKDQYWYAWAFVDATGAGPPSFTTAEEFHRWMGNPAVRPRVFGLDRWDSYVWYRLLVAPPETVVGLYDCHA